MNKWISQNIVFTVLTLEVIIGLSILLLCPCKPPPFSHILDDDVDFSSYMEQITIYQSGDLDYKHYMVRKGFPLIKIRAIMDLVSTGAAMSTSFTSFTCLQTKAQTTL